MHEVTIGRHAFWFEPPDLLRGEILGDVSAEEMRGFVAFTRARSRDCPRLLLMVGCAGLGDIPVDARREASPSADIHHEGIAVYGARFSQRLIASLVLNAVRLLGRTGERPIAFFATEAEARRWIEARREVVARAVLGSGPPR